MKLLHSELQVADQLNHPSDLQWLMGTIEQTDKQTRLSEGRRAQSVWGTAGLEITKNTQDIAQTPRWRQKAEQAQLLTFDSG